MRINAIETILFAEFPNLAYVQVHTDEGLVGLGETFFAAEAVASWVHSVAAPYLLGKDPLRIEQHWQGLNGFVGFNCTGVEMRARSAVDVALWDLLGQVCGQPIHQLLGGAVRDSVPVYNTCAGYRYVRGTPPGGGLPVGNWGIGSAPSARPPGPYEDLDAFLQRADELAESLLAEGIRGMKIARALEEFEPAWYEDPIKMDDLGALAKFADSTRVPTAASETFATRWSYRDLLERRAAGMVIYDPTWCGGITESKKIASMAEAYQLPATAHDCVGPVSFAVAVHLSIHAPNTPIQEVVRAFYTGWYQELVTAIPEVRNGSVYPLLGAGLGTKLLPDRLTRPDVKRRLSKLGE